MTVLSRPAPQLSDGTGGVRAHLGLVKLLLSVGDFVPDDGPDVLDDHGVLLDVPSGVQAQPLRKRTCTHLRTTWLPGATGLQPLLHKGTTQATLKTPPELLTDHTLT